MTGNCLKYCLCLTCATQEFCDVFQNCSGLELHRFRCSRAIRECSFYILKDKHSKPIEEEISMFNKIN